MSERETNQSDNTQPRFFYGFIVVAAALLIMLLAYGARLSFGVFFKPMATEFGWARALTSGAFTLSMVMQGVWGIFMGKLNDRFGPRFIMTLCCFCLGLGLVLMSQIGHVWQLYLFYGVIIGIGMGGVFVALLSCVTRWFIKRRGAMTGTVLIGIGLGTLVMSPVSNWLISIYAWRTSYIIVGGIVLLIGISASQFLRRDPAQTGLLPYGQNEIRKQDSASHTEGLSLREAVLTRQFWMVAVTFGCLGYAIFAISIHLVPHVTDLGISAATAANILAASGGLQVVGGILLGGLADRIGNRWALAISLILISASMFWLVPVTAIWTLYLFAIIYGTGIGGGAVMESLVVAEQFGMKAHGFILGVISFVFTIGGAVGPFLTGYIFDVTRSYQSAFLLCGGLGIVSIILTVILKPPKQERTQVL